MTKKQNEPVADSTSEATEVHRRKRSRMRLALWGLCAVAIVVGGIFGGLGWQQWSAAQARQEALDAGRAAATKLLTYDYRDLERSMDSRMAALTGDFREQYRSMLEDTVLPSALKQKVHTTAKVVSASVVAGGSDEVTLLLFINQTSKAPALKEPLLSGSRVEMTLQNHDGHWLIANLEPV